MFHAIKKARLEKAITKADFFHTCPQPEIRIDLIRYAFNHLTHKPQTAYKLFTNWEGNKKAIVFVSITVLRWMVENKFAKVKNINDKYYYYI